MAYITQLVRVLDCGSKSRRFEPCYSPFIKKFFFALNGFLYTKKVNWTFNNEIS